MLATVSSGMDFIVFLIVALTVAVLFAAMVLRICCSIARVEPPSFGRACRIAALSTCVFWFATELAEAIVYDSPVRQSGFGPYSELVAYALGVGIAALPVICLYRFLIPLPNFSRATLLFAINLLFYIGLSVLLGGLAMGFLRLTE